MHLRDGARRAIQAVKALALSAPLVLGLGAALTSTPASAQTAERLPESDCPGGGPRAAAPAAGRFGLVIANAAYKPQIGALSETIPDGSRVCRALEATGFRVTVVIDAGYQSFWEAIREHSRRLAAAGPAAVGFFYYSGHGAALEEDGDNYLIPVDADIERASELPGAALRLGAVAKTITGGGYVRSQANFVVIDACRNVAFQAESRSGTRGLVPVREASGLFIAFSTAPNDTALDKPFFSSALAEELQRPNQPAYLAFRNVRRKVWERSQYDQFPWFRDGLLDTFYFKRDASAPEVSGVRPLVERRGLTPVASEDGGGIVLSDPRCALCPDMAVVPEGEVDGVSVPGFAIALREVTFEEWDQCAADGACGRYWPDDMGWGRERRPAINLSYADAEAYAAWLSDKTDKPYRLPTDAEWSLAARGRAPETRRFAFGDDPEKLCGYANGGDHLWVGGPPCEDEHWRRTAPVGAYKPNDLGLYDMAGNVWEWVSGCAGGAPEPGGPGEQCPRTLRGGSWESGPGALTPEARREARGDLRRPTFGLRIALDWPN